MSGGGTEHGTTTNREDEMKLTIDKGPRRIGGTDWPRTTTIERDGKGRKPWLVTYSICNGVAGGAEHFATKKEALRLIIAHRPELDT